MTHQLPGTQDVFSVQLCGTIDTYNKTDISTGGTMVRIAVNLFLSLLFATVCHCCTRVEVFRP